MDKKLILNKLILHFAEGNNQKFAEILGITPTSLSNWKARGTIDYEKIYTKCEGVNPHWLLTGEGDMLLVESVNKSVSKKEGKGEKCKQPNKEEKMECEKERFYRRLEEMEKREEARDFLLNRIATTLEGINKILARLPQNPENENDVKNNSSMCG